MATLVDRLTYRAFYDDFKEAFIRKEYPDGKANIGRGDDSPSIWEHKNPKTNKVRVLEIIEFCLKDEKYFYRQLALMKTSEGKKVNSKALGKALEYLEYKIPENLEKIKGAWDEKAEVLLKQFKERINSKKKNRSTNNGTEDDTSCLEDAKQTVENFYHYLSVGNTQAAWELLSVSFQNREIWEGNFDRFHDGYATTLALRNICAFNALQIAPTLIECNVFYEDEVSTYPINGLQAIKLMTVSELDDFVAVVKRIQKDIEKKGGKYFEKIPLSKLFDPTGMEFIWYECGFKGNELHKYFAKPHPEIVLRLYQCYCILHEGRWVINNISPLKTYSIR